MHSFINYGLAFLFGDLLLIINVLSWLAILLERVDCLKFKVNFKNLFFLNLLVFYCCNVGESVLNLNVRYQYENGDVDWARRAN